MATAVLSSHDALNNRMHLHAFAPSPTRPRRRRSPKPAAASSPSPPPAKTGRRSPPPKTAARKQQPSSPTREKPVVRILRRGEEPPAPAPEPVAAQAAVAAASTKRVVVRSANRIGPKEPTAVVPRKVVSAAGSRVDAVYAGPAFNSAPEPSSLPFPAFCLRRAETEATRGLRCLLGIGQLA